MVILKEIKRQNNIISAFYISPLNQESKGYIEYDINKKSVVRFEYNEDDKKSMLHGFYEKALRCLKNLVEDGFKEGETLDRYDYYWY